MHIMASGIFQLSIALVKCRFNNCDIVLQPCGKILALNVEPVVQVDKCKSRIDRAKCLLAFLLQLIPFLDRFVEVNDAG